MGSCFDVATLFLTELNKNKEFIAVVLFLYGSLTTLLYFYTKANPSDRRAAIIFQDSIRNFVISSLVFVLSPFIISIFCYTFGYLNGNTYDFDILLMSGLQVMRTFQSEIISLIKVYRTRILEEFGPLSIVYKKINSFGRGSVIIPSYELPPNTIFMENANLAIGGLNAILVSISIQKFLLELLTSTNLFFLVLVVGLIIRLIPGLKDVGEFVFSLSLGIFILLPFLYTIFFSPFLENYYSISGEICNDLTNSLKSDFGDFSFYFLTPMTCYDLALIEILTVGAVFIPNLIFGLTFSFVSNFKKLFDIFTIGE